MLTHLTIDLKWQRLCNFLPQHKQVLITECILATLTQLRGYDINNPYWSSCNYGNVHCTYSQNNINVVYCNYKEITIRYREITEHNFPHSIPNAHAGIICDPLNENLTIVCIIHVLRKFQLKCMNRVKMCATKIILHKYLTIQ